MAGLAPNSRNINRTKRSVSQTTHLVVHPEYDYWFSEWVKIRDCLAGEKEIKRKGETYLPSLPGADPDDYARYIGRAVFYNMTSQTQAGMVGQMFRREPQVRNLPGATKDTPSKFVNQLKRFAKDGTSHVGFAKTVAGEQVAMGRFGALVDAPAIVQQADPQSFVVGYAADNILDWTIEEVEGFWQPTRILLREFVRDDFSATQDNPWIGAEPGTKAGATAVQVARTANRRSRTTGARPSSGFVASYTFSTRYRELALEPMEFPDGIVRLGYVQRIYKDDPTGIPTDIVTPQIRGIPLRFIPFVFFGSLSNAADCEKPPLLDIANLNLSHYRSYAELEHALFYTALPVYTVSGKPDSDAAEYHIGPGTVWEIESGEKVEIKEFEGKGLDNIVGALNSKESQIAAIGGRLMPGNSKSVSESDNQIATRESNEQSLLVNVIMALEDGMSRLVRYWLMFRDVPLSETVALRYEIDTTFLTTAIDARALRALQQLAEGGLLTMEDLYEPFQKQGVISSTVTLQEFTARLKSVDSFFGLPDAVAMRRGFASRAQELEESMRQQQMQIERDRMEIDRQRLEIEQQKLEIAKSVGSTSVSATRKLGDPEQAAPSKAEVAQVGVQREGVQAQERSAKAAAAAKPPAPPSPKPTRR